MRFPAPVRCFAATVTMLAAVPAFSDAPEANSFPLTTILAGEASTCFSGFGPEQGMPHGNGGIMMPCNGYEDRTQSWRATPIGPQGYFTLSMLAALDHCLESQAGPDAAAPLGGAAYLAACDASKPGQFWYAEARPDFGFFLRSVKAGPDRCLAGNGVGPGAALGGRAFMDSCQNVTTQIWIGTVIENGIPVPVSDLEQLD